MTNLILLALMYSDTFLFYLIFRENQFGEAFQLYTQVYIFYNLIGLLLLCFFLFYKNQRLKYRSSKVKLYKLILLFIQPAIFILLDLCFHLIFLSLTLNKYIYCLFECIIFQALQHCPVFLDNPSHAFNKTYSIMWANRSIQINSIKLKASLL